MGITTAFDHTSGVAHTSGNFLMLLHNNFSLLIENIPAVYDLNVPSAQLHERWHQ